MSTSGSDLVVAMWRLLDEYEREETYRQISDLRLIEQAGEDSAAARMIRSLRLVAECIEASPSPGDYEAVRETLVAAGEDIATLHEQTKHWKTWRRAKEALALSESQTPRRIDARFRFRRLGKVWRYTEETLGVTLRACAEHYGGRPPTVAEFDWWRDREIQKAQARGDIAGEHIPSASPYRRKWKTWEGALLHFGFTLEEATQRFQP